ncbi:hypothetical protein [Streptomyces nogalater]|uniref:Uncharacterized protein n=1 Tax=Streptomyces nogalater TaxID=38314 RepID=A0ABW0WBS9_STRNO
MRRTVHTLALSDGLLAGKVRSGLFAGAKVGGSITPTSQAHRCPASGLRASPVRDG